MDKWVGVKHKHSGGAKKIMEITKSPSGALSPYYYKGGYFHGIHYGSYFNDMDGFASVMAAEEECILRSSDSITIMCL